MSYWYLRHFDLGGLHPNLDFFNLMSYDFHGIWDANISSLGPYVQSHTNMAPPTPFAFLTRGKHTTRTGVTAGCVGCMNTVKGKRSHRLAGLV